MIKYLPDYTQVTFSEVPDEISLCINLTKCPHRCPGCHSPFLRDDIGDELTVDIVKELISKNSGITCVCFMGGDNDPDTLLDIAKGISTMGLKLAWYSGSQTVDFYKYGWVFDYIKIGGYRSDLGGLDKKTTNQKMYKIGRFYNQDYVMLDNITNKFWKDDKD